MIKVYKSDDAPNSLSTTKAYDGEDVKQQLLSDQHQKCYLCERKGATDFTIEHLQSEDNYPDKIRDWNNLFLACGYCNQKKGEHFDDILDPSSNDVEDEIMQEIDFAKDKAIFTSRVDDEPHKQTIQLLERIFNGVSKARKIKEKQFFNYVKSEILAFQKKVLNYQMDSSLHYS